MAHTDGNYTSIPSTQSMHSVPVFGSGVVRSTNDLTRKTWSAIVNRSGSSGTAAHYSHLIPIPSQGEFKELEQVPYTIGNWTKMSTGGASECVDYGPTGYRLDLLLQPDNGNVTMPDCDEKAFTAVKCGQKTSFRYHYKDYPSYDRQVNVLKSKDGKLIQPSKGRLALLAAQEMKHYLENHPDFPFALSDLWLRSIDKPSQGTLQPHLWTTKVVTQPGYPRRSGTM
ncbi:hypothetical protein C8Q74DRAFT_436749 [Fomes fomentarius]|nr:hypothetical protein C8Q74DRAFT_436749 [Fomes fomentarius]